MDKRKDMQMSIFSVLTQNIDRNNKNQYCDEHAFERAKIIEQSLYTNCNNMNIHWEKLYLEIDVNLLVDKVEEKTSKCVYLKT